MSKLDRFPEMARWVNDEYNLPWTAVHQFSMGFNEDGSEREYRTLLRGPYGASASPPSSEVELMSEDRFPKLEPQQIEVDMGGAKAVVWALAAIVCLILAGFIWGLSFGGWL